MCEMFVLKPFDIQYKSSDLLRNIQKDVGQGELRHFYHSLLPKAE